MWGDLGKRERDADEEGCVRRLGEGGREVLVLDERERKTVVFKHLGRRVRRDPAGVAEASHRVRLQVHPVQTPSKGKSGQNSPTPTARPQTKLPYVE